MRRRKQKVISKDIAEKVKLTENLLLCYSCDIEPLPKELERAIQLGIDVEGLKAVQGNDEASTYD